MDKICSSTEQAIFDLHRSVTPQENFSKILSIQIYSLLDGIDSVREAAFSALFFDFEEIPFHLRRAFSYFALSGANVFGFISPSITKSVATFFGFKPLPDFAPLKSRAIKIIHYSHIKIAAKILLCTGLATLGAFSTKCLLGGEKRLLA